MNALIGICAVAVVAWFAVGSIRNVGRGRALMRWMQGGLPLFGERATVRWLGSTAVELVIREAKAPFAAVTLVLVFEARDLPWMWALGRLRGRRDTLIVYGELRNVPTIDFEALDTASWSGREARRRIPANWLQHRAGGHDAMTVHLADAAALSRASALVSLAQRGARNVFRLSVRKTAPNFQLHVALPDVRQSARGYFEALEAIAQGAAG